MKPVTINSGDSVVDKKWNNADTDAETCYIQIRERTARTRQRKVRERTNPLPNLELPLDGGNPPSKPSAEPTPTTTRPEPAEAPEPVKRARIGSSVGGEVLWDDADNGEEDA